MLTQSGCSPTPNVFTIYTGDDKTMNLKAVFAGSFTPYDLTDCTEISVKLPYQDGTFVELKLSDSKVAITSPAILGAFTVTISEIVSTLLKIAEFQTFEVTFTIGGLKNTISYFNALTVIQNFTL